MKHDAHAAPPGGLRLLFKQWRRSSLETVSSSFDVLDTASLEADHRVNRIVFDHDHQKTIRGSFRQFLGGNSDAELKQQAHYFEVKALPGGHSLWQHGIVVFSF